MARRSDHTREELKILIITEGLQLVMAEGFSGFGARKLASRIGYTVGTIYHIFGSLDELILQMNSKTLDALYNTLEHDVKKAKGNKVIELGRSYLNFAQANYNLWSAMFEHKLSNDSQIPEWYQQKMSRFFDLTEDAIRPYIKKSKIESSAKILWASVHGISILALSGKLEIVGAAPAEKLIDNLITGFLKGNSPDPVQVPLL